MSDHILLDDLINDFRSNVYADCPCALTFDGDTVKLESIANDAKTGTSIIKEIVAPQPSEQPSKPKSKKK